MSGATAVRVRPGETAPEDPSEELALRVRAGNGRARREKRPPTGDSSSAEGAGGGRLALGDVVAGAWEGLLAAGSAACPVCEAQMDLDGAVARCGRCAARLS
jgi:hypothetical protein